MGLESGQLKFHPKQSPRTVGKVIARCFVFPKCVSALLFGLSVFALFSMSCPVFSDHGLWAGIPFFSPQEERVLGLCSPSFPGSASASSVPSSHSRMSGGSGRYSALLGTEGISPNPRAVSTRDFCWLPLYCWLWMESSSLGFIGPMILLLPYWWRLEHQFIHLFMQSH